MKNLLLHILGCPLGCLIHLDLTTTRQLKAVSSYLTLEMFFSLSF